MFVSWYLRYGLLGHSLLASFLLHRATAFNFLVGPKLSEETFLSPRCVNEKADLNI